MKKLLVCILFLMNITLAKTVEDYVQELRNLTQEQYLILAQTYMYGKRSDLAITLTAIVWKESSFGKHLANSKDGKYGSFGLGQILLETAMARHGYKTDSQRRKLKYRLMTDSLFNLKQAVIELKYWKKIYKDRKDWDWLRKMIASYNTGWKGRNSIKGKKYSDDVNLRMRALRVFFQTTKEFKNTAAKEHLIEVQNDVRNKKRK